MGEHCYKIEKKDGIIVLAMKLDDITQETNEALLESFTQQVKGGVRKVVLDLSQTGFMPSIVIATLVIMVKRLREIGGDVVVCGVGDWVSRLFRVTHLDRVFVVFDNADEACQYLSKIAPR
ncbi:MAG: STAS domain-containing protein [Candidatus Omnitrophota bacterium]